MQPLHRFTVQRMSAQTRLFKQSGATHLAFFASNARLFATSSQHGQVRCLLLHAGASALHSCHNALLCVILTHECALKYPPIILCCPAQTYLLDGGARCRALI